jgi:hypothetical protein
VPNVHIARMAQASSQRLCASYLSTNMPGSRNMVLLSIGFPPIDSSNTYILHGSSAPCVFATNTLSAEDDLKSGLPNTAEHH